MQVPCPHCRNTLELADDRPPDEVLCPTCGSSFRLDPGRTTSWQPEGAASAVGRFVLQAVLGSGAFGTVYRARDPQLDRAVAVKVPRAGTLAGPGVLDRFLREARSAAQLRHPHIVTVHEVGQHDGLPYLVSDLVEGVTLADRLTAGPPSPRDTAALVADVADALQYAHERGVTHRDVKPSNIMLDGDGRPRVMDFGLAKRDAGEVTMTLEGQVLGTPAYMSPEQARGEGHAVDGRSDVYSLGVVLYQLLTGELPFRGNQRMLLHQVLHDEPRPPRALNDRVPRDLETVCLKAMAKEPARRYPSAGELAADLRRFLGGEPIHARPVGRAEKLWRWCRRNPTVAGLGTAVFALVLCTALGSTVAAFVFRDLAEREREATGAAEQSARQASEAGLRAQQNADESRRRLARRYVAQAAGLIDDGGLLDALPWLVEALRLEQDDPERQRMHRTRLGCVLRACPKLVYSWPCDAQVAEVSFAGDGRYIIANGVLEFAGHTRQAVSFLWDVEAGAAVPLPREADEVPRVAALSRDGRLAVGAADGTVRVFDLATGRRLAGPLAGQTAARGLAFSPDGRHLAADADGITVWDTATGQAMGRPLAGREPRFSPDGRRLATQDGTVWEWAAGRRLFVPPLEVQPSVWPPEFSPDGGRILLNCKTSSRRQSDIRVYELATGRLVAGPLARHSVLVWKAVFSPDGTRVATTGEDGNAWAWDLATASPLCPPLRHRFAVNHAAFSPDGALLLTCGADQAARVWDLATGDPASAWLRHRRRLFYGAFSPDGRLLVTGGFFSGDVRVWEWAPGGEVALPSPAQPGDGEGLVALRPDGAVRATWGRQGGVRLHSLVTGQPLGQPFDPGMPFSSGARLEFVGGRALLTGHRTATPAGQSLYRLWDAGTGRPLSPVLRGWEVVGWHCGDGGCRVLRVAEGRPGPGPCRMRVEDPVTGAAAGPEFVLPLREQDRIDRAVFSTDGRLVATVHGWSDYGTCEVWDVATGRLAVPPLLHKSGVLHAVFSADGRRIATASDDQTARVWDVATGRPVTPPLWHAGPVWKVALSGDGRLLVTEADNRSRNGAALAVWDAASGEPVLPAVRLPVQRSDVAIDAERGRVVAAARGVRAWSLAPEGAPVADLEALAAALAGARLDPGGTPVRLDDAPPPEQAAALRARFAAYFSRSRGDGPAWHEQQARAAEGQEQWFAAAWHLTRLLDLGQKDAVTRRRRARARERLNELDGAAADYEAAVGLDPGRWRDWSALGHVHARRGHKEAAARAFAAATEHDADDPVVWYNLAVLRADAADRDAYRRTCADILARFGQATDPEAAYFVALACGLQDGAAADLRGAVAAIRKVAAERKVARYLSGLGYLLYRTGDVEGAVKSLNEAMTAYGKEGEPWQWLVLALAHGRLGHNDEARDWLRKGVAWLDGPAGRDLSWNDRLYLELLRREAAGARDGP